MSRQAVVTAVAIALGLPSALIAHALVFGGTHAAGGDLHAALLALASATALCAAVTVALAACLAGPATVQGTVLARRMREYTPRLRLLVPSTASWFAGIEACERFTHHVPLVAAVTAVAIAAFAVRRALSAVARSFAVIAVVVVIALRTQRRAVPASHRVRRPVRALPTAVAHRRIGFSRPPPVFA